MQRFFNSLESLQHYLSEFRLRSPRVHCPHCHHGEHLIVHDTVRKKARSGQTLIVGRRLFCSNRGQQQGCGRTVRLSLADRIPGLYYGAQTVCLFILALLDGLSIGRAYAKATGQSHTRHAFRWMARLEQMTAQYRSRGAPHAHGTTHPTSDRCTLILQSLTSFFSKNHQDICQHYQRTFQAPFI